MGGSGSGHRYDSKGTTSDYFQLDVRRWNREGRLGAGNVFWWADMRLPPSFIRVQVERFLVVLAHAYRDREGIYTGQSQRVWLEWTPCHFGGKRPWFLCPGCERRVAKLCIATEFRCRHCLELAYESQHQSRKHRSLYMASKIRTKLGGSGSLADPPPPKPKHMHWRTYRRLCRKLERRESMVFGAMAAWLDRKSGRSSAANP
jgi:hypothetical protein